MLDKKPNWHVLKECAEELTKRGTVPFTRKQLIDCVQSKYPDRGESSLNPMIQGITVNLKGGAPGGIGKKILVSISRGLFKLYSGREDMQAKTYTKPEERSDEIYQRPTSVKGIGTTEDKIRDEVMKTLFYNLGEQGTWEGDGKSARFKLKSEFGNVECGAEKSLDYKLPDGGALSHASDILITDISKERYISIEIKHKSAVTDQFKCRSYDMIHMKNTYGSKLLGIMLFVKTTQGISIEQAEKICYPFDYFFGIPSSLRDIPTVWDKLISAIGDFLGH
jgi:hypothetical protein